MEVLNNSRVVGIPLKNLQHASSTDHRRLTLHSASCGRSGYKPRHSDLVANWMNKFSKKAENIRDHVNLGTNFSETLKGKFNLGAKIFQAGGLERIFRKNFCIEKGEKLSKAFQCYLYTTAGPIAGLLFISNKKIAFHSDRSLKLTSPKGNLTRVPYKVLIPVGSIKRAIQSENTEKPSQKYIQIVTVDDFEFWFMGFLSYKRSFKHLKQAISDSQVGILQLTQ
ncbi:GEM-like protein 7 [Zingiber officinale]|uniref:GRAM domain-containing protein n=1 Tax=Zingiber officinale TaxID=94328 RepID=A0A8J5F022_ZINOF|nr:GEM-like protein 7 [Zingiber officinale]KAG6478473.1 hypothetical protein ZIOFF_061916 [Zingiber officinale]